VPAQVTLPNVASVSTIADGNARSMPTTRALNKSRRSGTKVPFNGEVTRQWIAAALMTKVKAERAIADTPEAEVLKEAILVIVRACAQKMISTLKK
jgi:hypothetical protein